MFGGFGVGTAGAVECGLEVGPLEAGAAAELDE